MTNKLLIISLLLIMFINFLIIIVLSESKPDPVVRTPQKCVYLYSALPPEEKNYFSGPEDFIN